MMLIVALVDALGVQSVQGKAEEVMESFVVTIIGIT